MADISVTREIAAPPEKVWALISAMTRMGEWSPESTGGRWLKGATGPEVGCRFRGTNEAGGKKWATTCEVEACEPGRRFAFRVFAGPIKVARWDYELEPSAEGCLVTESWTDQRHPLFAWLTGRVTGVTDRARHNQGNIEQTLEALDGAATATA